MKITFDDCYIHVYPQLLVSNFYHRYCLKVYLVNLVKTFEIRCYLLKPAYVEIFEIAMRILVRSKILVA